MCFKFNCILWEASPLILSDWLTGAGHFKTCGGFKRVTALFSYGFDPTENFSWFFFCLNFKTKCLVTFDLIL